MSAPARTSERVRSYSHARRILANPPKFGDPLQIEARKFTEFYLEAEERMDAYGKCKPYWEGVLDGRYDVDSLDSLNLEELQNFIVWLKEGEE